MYRTATSVVAALALAIPVVLVAQQPRPRQSHQTSATPAASKPSSKAGGLAAAKKTDAQKIANAMSAAPAEISRNATIMDWPATPNGQPRQLRAGTNGWVCYPASPASPAESNGALMEDPMCFDKIWQSWGEAWMSKKDPPTGASGIAYMLRGDKGASNTDPFATSPTASNQWVVSPAHIMVLFTDNRALDAYPTDPNGGGPWVMWKGTPYAHLMVPVSPTKAATTAMK